MSVQKYLVAFHSRTGHTRCVGDFLATALQADREEIRDDGARGQGFLGYMRAGFEGWRRRLAPIGETTHDPANYEMVLVGTPVWSYALSSPVRTYLEEHKHSINKVAFFATQGGEGAEKAFEQMAGILGKAPVATLVINEAELKTEEWNVRAEAFLRSLQ